MHHKAHKPKSDLTYKSSQEATVGSYLSKLIKRKEILGFFPQVKYPNSNKSADFLIIRNDGSFLFVEYDGIREKRMKSLQKKVSLIQRLREVGFDIRWLLDATLDGIRKMLGSDYSDPSFIYKTVVCNKCHKILVLLVIGQKNFIENTICEECKKCSK